MRTVNNEFLLLYVAHILSFRSARLVKIGEFLLLNNQEQDMPQICKTLNKYIMRIMKILASMLLLLMLTNLLLSANSKKRNNIIGSFTKGAGSAVIEVKQKNGLFQGYVVSNDENPENIGNHIFKNVKYNADKMLWKGKLYAKKRDKLYDFEMIQESDKKFVMTIKVGFLSKDIIWIKH